MQARKWLSYILLMVSMLTLVACGGGGGSSGSSNSNSAGQQPDPEVDPPVEQPPVEQPPVQEPQADPVSISGRVTYDSVPHNPFTSGLNYDATEILPVRGAEVQLLDASGSVVDQTTTNNQGFYEFNNPVSIDVRVLVRAETIATGTPAWSVRVGDNTSGGALYALQGALLTANQDSAVRNLHAPSGWNNVLDDYTETRAAAPFAILDAIYSSIETFVAVDGTVQFPHLDVFWSENNIPAEGDLTEGEITTSFFQSGSNSIYILGAEDIDTDEYDSHVIAHEWGHFFEAALSRADSIGGSHSLSSVLDMRVAMSEGWGNAVSGIILDDSVYRDSSTSNQSRGFAIDVESNNNNSFNVARGWFSEASVQSIIYDIYDANNEGVDNISAGLRPIYDVLTSASYRNSSVFTGIHMFLDSAKSRLPASADRIDDLAEFQLFTVDDELGSTETNDAGSSSVLPIYTDLSVGETEEVCVTSQFGTNNRLGNRRYLRISNLSSGFYTFTVTRTSGSTQTNPEVFLQRLPDLFFRSVSTQVNIDEGSANLAAGDYVLEVFDANQNSACFNVSFN